MNPDEAWLARIYGPDPNWNGSPEDRRLAVEERCRKWLEEIVWPDGAECPNHHFTVKETKLTPTVTGWLCLQCDRKFKVTQALKVTIEEAPERTRTFAPMAGQHWPLERWFRAIYLLHENPGLSWSELARHVGGGWHAVAKHGRDIQRMRQADPELLELIVAGPNAGAAQLRKRQRRRHR